MNQEGMEARVARTPEFLQCLEYLCREQHAEAIDCLGLLRDKYTEDQWSLEQIDGCMVQALNGAGRHEEALALLYTRGASQWQSESAKSSYFLSVVSLLQNLRKTEQLDKYCKSVDGQCKAEYALFHLEWIDIYAGSIKDSEPTQFMRAILADCAPQLGLDPPSSEIRGDEFRRTVKHYWLTHKAANERYGAFWNECKGLAAGNHVNSTLQDYVTSYISTESVPVFRDLARRYLAESHCWRKGSAAPEV